MKDTWKYQARVVDNETLEFSEVEGEVEVPQGAPAYAATNTARYRISQSGRTDRGVEVAKKS
ncbi:hypothetical protein ACFY3G_29565 [Streptomyces phaeochromogenes]|uniref:hypothetical protein n=1 Tax=Streptomyces phaeochromogenes TaxID=1923 RepID=UPI0036A06EC6